MCEIYPKFNGLNKGTKSRFTVYLATRYYWLINYCSGFSTGLITGRYEWQEFKSKLKAAFIYIFNQEQTRGKDEV